MLKYSGKDVSRAGDVLIQENIADKDHAAYEQAMEVLSYWRSCHEAPLTQAVRLLTETAQKYDDKAVVAKRLKRTPSILNKLRRFKGMTLRSMQDIGGCRAIVANEKRVRKLVRELKKKKDFRIKDYITKPKEDGYRSIHLVSDFSNGHEGVRPIEIQVRTAAQHAWATAVEIIDLFTGEAIKANRGSAEWQQFFRCASDQLAFIEDIPVYNQISTDRLARELFVRLKDDTKPDRQEFITKNTETLYVLEGKLSILENFNAYASSLKAADDHFTKAAVSGYVLLEIDLKKKKVDTRIFKKEDFAGSTTAYLEAEKRAAVTEGLVVALVSTDAVGGIKEAYPNYFADSSLFLNYVAASREAYRAYNQSGLSRAFKRLFG